VKINIKGAALFAALIIGSMLLVACGGDDPTPAPSAAVETDPDEPAPGEFDPVVDELPADQAANILAIPDASGNTPCGVFDVGGFGDRIVELRDYDDCIPSNPSVHTLACLDGNAQWSDANVFDINPSGTTLEFVSNQEGTCGIFIIPDGDE